MSSNLPRDASSFPAPRSNETPRPTEAPTLGVDLSAQARATGACLVRWERVPARLGLLATGFGDHDLLGLIQRERPIKVAIDAPFGWPAAFVALVGGYADGRDLPSSGAGTQRYRLRATDLATLRLAGPPAPLSVSTDRIGVCAIRCVGLLAAMTGGAPVDRTGAGPAVEVYPAAALRVWGLGARGYKRQSPESRRRRRELVLAFREATAGWLELADHEAAALCASDHLLDALVAAVVARAHVVGDTVPIPDALLPAARSEGWIRLPRPRPLAAFDPFPDAAMAPAALTQPPGGPGAAQQARARPTGPAPGAR